MKRPPLVVGIVGGSGAGKSLLARRLQSALAPHAAGICADDFYQDRSHLPAPRRARINFDHPRAIDWPFLERILRDYAAGKTLRLPMYDFRTHCRVAGTKRLQPRPILILDGLWLFRRPQLRRWMDFRIYIDCPKRTRWTRRLSRDLSSRDRDPEAIRRQFRTTVEPMHGRFVVPQRRWADLVLPGNFGRREITRVLAEVRARRLRKAAGHFT